MESKILESQPPKIFTQMSAVMKSIGAVGKNQVNQAQGSGYNFRGIDDVYNAVQPAMAEHGVFCTPEVIASESYQVTSDKGKIGSRVVLTIKFTFYALDGSSVTATTVGEAIDYSDKASNKAMSAAFKYALFQTFCIPTEGEDNDADKHTPESGTQQKQQPQGGKKPAPQGQPVMNNYNPINERNRIIAGIAQVSIRQNAPQSHEDFFKIIEAAELGQGVMAATPAQFTQIDNALRMQKYNWQTGELNQQQVA